MFIRNLSPASLDRQFSLGLGIFVILWTITGVFTAAFQCHVPTPWDYIHGQCFDLVRNAPGYHLADFTDADLGRMVELPRSDQYHIRGRNHCPGTVGHHPCPGRYPQEDHTV